jgi:FKBP12-rapamycin complex-associated protein
MSIVGYISGLGDDTFQLDAEPAVLLHIDFGDCFEAAMNRDKYPESVPFRLTRMLVKAMEVSNRRKLSKYMRAHHVCASRQMRLSQQCSKPCL